MLTQDVTKSSKMLQSKTVITHELRRSMITFIKEFPKPYWNVYSQKCSRRCDKDQSFKGQKAEDSRQKKKSFKKSLHQIKDLQVIQQHFTKSYIAHIKGESTYFWKFIPRLQRKDFKIRRLKNSRQVHTFRISKDNSDLWFNNPRRFNTHTLIILCSKRTLRINKWFNFKKSKTKTESSSPKTMRKLWRLVSTHQLSSPPGSSNSFLQDKTTRTSDLTIYH